MTADTATGFAVFAGVAPEIIRASAREAEARGLASFWVNHPGPVDGLGSLAHAAAETRRIDLGVGVIPLHTRGPEAIVEGVRQHGIQHYLDLVADGRIDLTGMLTHTFTLDDWRDAFTTLATQDETGAIKVAFDFRG